MTGHGVCASPHGFNHSLRVLQRYRSFKSLINELCSPCHVALEVEAVCMDMGVGPRQYFSCCLNLRSILQRSVLVDTTLHTGGRSKVLCCTKWHLQCATLLRVLDCNYLDYKLLTPVYAFLS